MWPPMTWKLSSWPSIATALSYGEEVLTTINQDQSQTTLPQRTSYTPKKSTLFSFEHEYGIFGGPDGSNLLELARALNAAWHPISRHYAHGALHAFIRSGRDAAGPVRRGRADHSRSLKRPGESPCAPASQPVPSWSSCHMAPR